MLCERARDRESERGFCHGTEVSESFDLVNIGSADFDGSNLQLQDLYSVYGARWRGILTVGL